MCIYTFALNLHNYNKNYLMDNNKELTSEEKEGLLNTLKLRFEKNNHRHEGIDWNNVKEKLETLPKKLWSLNEMERTGGEPDVVAYDAKTKEFVFYDCSAESPSGRRSFCYDRQALEKRKEHKPKNSVMDSAAEMGISLLDEAAYRTLQQLEKVDAKTSSWLKTPNAIRQLGGAIFGDFRYNTIFIYHNGADSYYATRGFRGSLRV